MLGFALSPRTGCGRVPAWRFILVAAVAAAVSAFGGERVLWGTGFPGNLRQVYGWPSLADELELIRHGLPFLRPNERDRILGGNATALRGL